MLVFLLWNYGNKVGKKFIFVKQCVKKSLTKSLNQAVCRLLADEFHLGYIICGKVTGRWDKETKAGLTVKSLSEWIRSTEISHKPLKTQEEHDSIIALMAQNRRRPVASRNGLIKPFSTQNKNKRGY